MKQLISAFALLFLVISATTLASSMNIRFANLDKDKDKQLSIIEAKQDEEVMKQFSDLDVNNDEMISVQEFKQFKP